MRFGLASVMVLSMTASVLAQSAPAEPRTRPAPASRDAQISRQEPMPHLLYLPRGYGKDGGGKLWPVVLFLHGSGESGHDLERVKKHGPPKLVSEGKQFPFILVSPQTDHGWQPEELGKLLDSIESQYAVDRTREYVTGLSMGGFGTWEMLAAFPNRFAAAVMICGGGNQEYAAKIKDTPLWVFHGEQDNVVPIADSQTVVDALKKLDGDVQFTTYPQAKHDSWTATYSNPKVYRWMLEHTRKPGAVASNAPTAIETKPASLREAGKSAGLLVGAAIAPEALNEKSYADTLAREFNFITPENVMKWGLIQPEPEKWNYGPADTLVEFAQKHGMKVKGHCLIWHEQLPKYINADMTPQQLREAIRSHILSVAGRYKGKLYAWDVVNEAIDDKDGFRNSLFFQKLGEDFIAEAFRIAHEADPKALLIYNEYGAEGLNGKSDRVYDLVKRLKADGVPIGGVGLQMHIAAQGFPKPEDIAANVRRLVALGLQVNISEMDVRIKDLKGELPARLDVQRAVYHDVIAACVREQGFTAVTFWGFTDAHSWVDHFFGPDDPLPFDENYKPKPTYQGVIDALSAGKRP